MKTKLILLYFAISLFSSCALLASNIGNNVYGIYSETYPGLQYNVQNSTNGSATPDGGCMLAEGWIGLLESTTNIPWQGGTGLLWPGGDSSGFLNKCTDYTLTPEGGKCLRSQVYSMLVSSKIGCPRIYWSNRSASDGYWWSQFGYDTSTVLINGVTNYAQMPTNMGAYSGGTIEFDIKTTTEIYVQVQWLDNWGQISSGTVYLVRDYGVPLSPVTYGDPKVGNWVAQDGPFTHVSIPLSNFTGISFSSITIPFSCSVIQKSNFGIWWIDNIVWKKPSLASFSVTLKNTDGTSTTASSVTWTNVTPGVTGWKAADQCFQLDVNYTASSWGIQVYTDNCNAAANPRFVGVEGSTINPAGMLGYNVNTLDSETATSSSTLPMCWRISDKTTDTLNIAQVDLFDGHTSTSSLYNPIWGSAYHPFLWMKDKGTPDIPSQNTTHFTNGEDYVVVWESPRGIHFGENTTEWGAAQTPNYLYIGAGFASAVTPRKYKTNRIVIEMFSD